jgi:hypothetical protein
VFAPHGVWLLTGVTPEITSQVSAKLVLGRDIFSLARSAASLLTLLKVILAFVAPLGLVYAVVFWVRNRPVPVRPPSPPENELFLERILAFELGLVAVLGAFVGVLGFKARWMQPLLFLLPLYLLLKLRSRINRHSVRRLLFVTCACASASLVVLGGRVIAADQFNTYTRFNAPFDSLAEDIRGQGFDGGVILADHYWTAGNLRLRFPQSVVLSPSYRHLPIPRRVPVLIVWQGEAQPPDLSKLLMELGLDDQSAGQARSVRLKYRYAEQVAATFTYVVLSRKV